MEKNRCSGVSSHDLLLYIAFEFEFEFEFVYLVVGAGLAAGVYSGLTYGLKEARGVHDWVPNSCELYKIV